MNITKELQEMTNTIASAKTEKANAEGQITQILKNLKTVSGTDDISKAQDKVENWEDEIENMNTKINHLFDKLNTNYNW